MGSSCMARTRYMDRFSRVMDLSRAPESHMASSSLTLMIPVSRQTAISSSAQL